MKWCLTKHRANQVSRFLLGQLIAFAGALIALGSSDHKELFSPERNLEPILHSLFIREPLAFFGSLQAWLLKVHPWATDCFRILFEVKLDKNR